MPELNHSIPRAILPLIFCVEKSTIAEINECFTNLIEMILTKIGKENADYICKSVVCSFNSDTCLDNLKFDDVPNINIRETVNDVSEGCEEKECSLVKLFETLDKNMSIKELFLDKPYLVPMIFWFIDGQNYYYSDDKTMNTLITNKWFKNSKHSFFSFNEVSESANEIKNKLTSPWYIFKKIGDQDLKEVCGWLFEDFEIAYSVHSVCNDDYFDRELFAKNECLLSPKESTLTRGLGFNVYNPNKEETLDFIESSQLISVNLEDIKLDRNSKLFEKPIEVVDELVKIDSISDNDTTDGDWLSGDTK